MDREILERPFPKTLIKTHSNNQGREFSYVEGHEYIKRLNDAFDGDWSFEIEHHNIMTDEVVVMGKLTAGGISKCAFGGVAIKRHRETGQPISLSDDLKAAATDALKKASSLLGVGLHLYGDEPKDRGKPPVQSQQQVQKRSVPRLTQKQLNAIWSIGRALGISQEEVRRRVDQVYSVSPEDLSKQDASHLIGVLSNELNGSRGVA